MASTKAASTIVANPSTIHRSCPPSFATPRLLPAICKALSVSAPTYSLRRSLSVFAIAHPSTASPTPTPTTPAPSPLHRFLSNEPRKGADILVEALEHEGITEVFAYPDGAFMEIHQVLTRSPSIANYLFCHKQGEVFTASGRLGVCIATSSPSATNLVSGLTDALLDSIPMVAITG